MLRVIHDLLLRQFFERVRLIPFFFLLLLSLPGRTASRRCLIIFTLRFLIRHLLDLWRAVDLLGYSFLLMLFLFILVVILWLWDFPLVLVLESIFFVIFALLWRGLALRLS